MKFIGFESDSSSRRWDQCEQIAKSQFKKTYNADIKISADTFITNSFRKGGVDDVTACIGFNFYEPSKPFFIEKYLKKPLPEIVKELTGEVYLPNEICEVGTMASIGRREGLELLTQLPMLTGFLNQKVGFVTITKQVQFILKQINLPYWEVCKADPSLVDNSEEWGSYYDNTPVCAFIIVNDAIQQTIKKEIRLNKFELELL